MSLEMVLTIDRDVVLWSKLSTISCYEQLILFMRARALEKDATDKYDMVCVFGSLSPCSALPPEILSCCP